MKKNNFKKRTAIIIGLLTVVFVLYFIFFFGHEAAAPVVPVEAVKSIAPAASLEVVESNVPTEVLKPDTIKFIPQPIATSSVAASSSATSSVATSSAPIKKNINISVPFTSQAPLTNWKDGRQEDGCEEAVSLMVMAWAKGNGTKTSPAVWEKLIVELSDFEQEKYGEYRDVTLSDMVAWIFNDYFKYNKINLKKIASSTDIISELEKGNIVLAPMNGQKLKNPYFTAPGPLTHMLLIKGYDYKTKEFITNDPGTRRGENYRYSEEIILGALNVYPTGSHEEISELKKAIIVVEK